MLQLPLFAFGTLRRGECNHGYLAGAFDRVLPAQLFGFARVAPLMIAREADSVVVGELFFLTATTYGVTLQNCDGLEELPTTDLIGQEYRRIAVKVLTEKGEFVCWAYARPDTESDHDLQQLVDAEIQRIRRM